MARHDRRTKRSPLNQDEEEATAIVPIERVERSILLVRGHKVLLDVDLADLYGVPTKALNQAVIAGVPEAVWNFHIGGYQVCEKWLKDRKGRRLSKDDIAHYQKIVVALSETIRLMKEIDQTIEKHGGWPGAFVTAPAEPT